MNNALVVQSEGMEVFDTIGGPSKLLIVGSECSSPCVRVLYSQDAVYLRLDSTRSA